MVLARNILDHNSLLVSLSKASDICWNKRKMFKYEASWSKHRDRGAMIKKVWRVKQGSQNPWFDVNSNLARCRKTLKKWVRKQGNPVEKQIQDKIQELHEVQMSDSAEVLLLEGPIKDELNDFLAQEEMKWKQRAKMNWLQFGDRNTKFFHAYATHRQRRNQIMRIQDFSGRLCTSKEESENAFVDYFSDLFRTRGDLEVESCIGALTCKVTLEMNHKLLAEFTIEDISSVLKQMSHLKAPRPDGFTACFFQQNWTTVHPKVCKAILYFLNTGEMDRNINATHIALIPKVQTPVCVTEFCRISLCNVVYKLISKVLTNRLNVILPEIISYTQSAFLPSRLISDKIIAAYETMHTMQTKMWSKTGYMGIKLDMSKAYDRVE
jgi:hypothetical protein